MAPKFVCKSAKFPDTTAVFAKSTNLNLTGLIILLMLMFVSVAQGAEVDAVMLEQAEALLKAGKAEEAYQMLEAQEVKYAGDLVFDYLLATSALESGKPSKATFIYERILAVDPSYVGVRVDMGRAYYELGDYARAKIEFETVLTFQNLPPDLRGTVEKYMQATDAGIRSKRTAFTAYVEAGYGYDNNVGSSTARRTVFLDQLDFILVNEPPVGRKTSDNYSTIGFGAEVNHQLDDHWGLFGGADYRIRGYEDVQDVNFWSVDTRAGVTYSKNSWLLRAGLTGGIFNFDGEHLRDNYGGTLDWRIAITPASQLSLGGSVTRLHYSLAEQRAQESEVYALSAGWLTSIGDGSMIFSLSGSGGYDKSLEDRDDGDKVFYGPRVLAQKNFGDSLGVYVTGGATYSKFDKDNDLYLKTRREMLYDATLGLTWTLRKGLSLRPQISYTENRSNLELFSYDKTDASVNIRYDM